VALVFSLSHSILQWDFAILSESLTFSLMAATISTFLVFYRLYMSNLTLWALIFFVVIVAPILFLFINTRDASAYLLLLIVPVFLAVFYNKKRLRQYIILAVLFLVASAGTYLYQSHSATVNHRWEMPLRHVIFSRVLTDPEALDYFKEKGMPVNDSLMELAGQAKAEAPPSIKPRFESWLSEHGKSVYMLYMVTHPVKTFHAFLIQLPSAINYPVIVKYYGDVHLGQLSHTLNAFFFNRTFHPFRWIIGLTAIPIAFVIVNRRYWKVHVLSLAATIAFVSQAYIGYMGDAIEGVRHELLGDVLFRVSIYMILLSMFYGFYSLWNQSGRKEFR
jgi:hypothetical protein